MPRLSKTSATSPAIDSVIHTIRGERVILDSDLAKIYGVATKVFNQAVKRNRDAAKTRQRSQNTSTQPKHVRS